MAVTRRVMAGVEPKDVFDVLRDGDSYEHWVVGTRKIRATDAGWPAPDTAIHYTIGYWPLRKDDKTTSLAYEPDVHLELEAFAWPAGSARIDIRAEKVADGTLVTIDEHPKSGPGAVVHNPLADGVIHLRNVEGLRRLEGMARRRRR
jgi:hypothetical protein